LQNIENRRVSGRWWPKIFKTGELKVKIFRTKELEAAVQVVKERLTKS
jgi:hypothetical protein